MSALGGVVGPKIVLTSEPSYQNKTCSECQHDVRKEHPSKDRKARTARKAARRKLGES